jgi:hypothetical protein
MLASSRRSCAIVEAAWHLRFEQGLYGGFPPTTARTCLRVIGRLTDNSNRVEDSRFI